MAESPVRHTILAVDDTPQNLDILKELLKDNYRVLLAKSGQGALDLLARAQPQPSLILLDIMMPGMDGFDTLINLRKIPGFDTVPVMFISAKDDIESKVRGFSLGAVDYITKPFEPDEVMARVRTHIALVEANRMRDDVERIMRHDLKSPLNAMVATARFELENNHANPDLVESLQIILDSGVAMEEMISLSLDIFKMEQGTYQPVTEKVDLNGLLATLHRQLLPQLQAADLQWTWEGCAPTDGVSREILSTRLLCYSLLGNLTRNAAEAAPRGSAITVRLVEEGTNGFLMTLRNQGEIPESLRPRLFQKYATAGKISGTGLGLYSARLISLAIGATLEADLTEPGFTAFRIRFPGTISNK